MTALRLGLARRMLHSVRRAHPYVLKDLPDNRTAVTMTGDLACPLGTFPTNLRAEFAPGFLLEPDPRGEPEILVEKPSLFVDNKDFWERAGAVLKKHIHEDPVFSDLVAAETRTAYFHIYDFRLPPLFGRIPEVEDILGTVELDPSADTTVIVPNSFEPNTMYRPVTKYGAMLTSPAMHTLLAEALRG